MNNYPLCICERTVETDRKCFAQQLYDDGNISLLEWKLYDEWYDWLINKTSLEPSAIIYLKVEFRMLLKKKRMTLKH